MLPLRTRSALFTPLALAIGALTSLACIGGDEPEVEQEPRVKLCPFTLPEPNVTFPDAPTVGLLSFPVFPDVMVQETGVEGKTSQYTAESIIALPDRSAAPSITYIQAFQGTSVLLTPDEVPAELERVDQNAKAIFSATTSTEMITLGGQQTTVHIAKSSAEQIMIIFVPIEDGALFAPVTLGVYATVAGCEETMSQTFEALKSGLSLNTQTTYHDLESIQQLKQEKLGAGQ